MNISLYTHPDCEFHEMPGHPERPDRLRSVMQRLNESGLTGDLSMIMAEEIDTATLQLIHRPEYVKHIAACEPTNDIIKVEPDTYMSPGSLRACKLAAGACVSATREVLAGRVKRVFCAIRPPGHHAEIAAAMGFCLFNNIALAAEVGLKDPNVNRVAIVDFDVHHCNGTVDIFKDRPEVLVCSSFQDHFYPYRYLDYTNDHILNMPLEAGTDGGHFRKRVEREWLPALAAYRPDLLLVSAGFDAHARDPLGELLFNESDYAWITAQLVGVADQYCQGRLVSTLEGGYDLVALADSVEVHVATLIKGS